MRFVIIGLASGFAGDLNTRVKLIHYRPFLSKAISGSVCAILLAITPAQAHSWNSNPQPLLEGRSPILADAGSPLAWDQSSTILWYFADGQLQVARWSGGTFHVQASGLMTNLNGGLAIDSGRHLLFCLDSSGLPQCVRRRNGKFEINPIGSEPLTRILGIDAGKHWVFGYDANARGIRQYSFDSKAKQWNSVLVATGLGEAGDSAAVDSNWHVIYSSHATVDPSILRHPSARTLTDPTGLGGYQPWPLVATALSGTTWGSVVLDETGVPQQPAVLSSNHRLFYAERDEPDTVHYFQPALGKKPESFGSYSGWGGTDTFEDNDSYPIEKPDYPWSGVVTLTAGGWTWTNPPLPFFIKLNGPITIVPCYKPIWTDAQLPPRLASFRASTDPRQSRLVQHCEIFSGEAVRQQTGSELMGYLYRDANGTLVTKALSTPPSGFVLYPRLGLDFDPTNPPASFAALANANGNFSAYPQDVAQDPTHAHPALATDIPAQFSTDPNAPLLPAYLRLPSQVDLHTFGHKYSSNSIDQPGARYRSYSAYGTSYAIPSSLAVDSYSGAVFYTQAQPPATDQFTVPAPSKDAFSPVLDPKLPPARAKVWIVMVY